MIRLADWYREAFAEMAFSIVVYQLTTPLTGTSQEIMNEVFRSVFIAGSIISALILVPIGILKFKFYDRDIVIRSDKDGTRKTVVLKAAHIKIIYGCTCAIVLITLVSMLASRAKAIGVPQYLREISQSSTIYEDEYVETKNVDITFPEKKRNLLLIYVESMESSFADTESGGILEYNSIPELTDLAEKNINFSSSDKMGGFHVYGIGFTMAGLLASTSGINYKVPVTDTYQQMFAGFLPGVTSLGDVLKKNGYTNYFQCGSMAEFAGRDTYLMEHGDYQIKDLTYAREKGYVPEDYNNGFWGYEDLYLYEIAKRELTDIASLDEPFNYTMLTVDTHTPAGYVCEFCPDKFEDQYANVLACASKQLYDFIKWAELQDWYENTTILVMGDHTTMADYYRVGKNKLDFDAYSREVYNCFINCADGLDTTHVKNREFSTCDIFPTILAAMGVQIDGDRLGLGTNLFSGMPTIPERIGRDVFYEELQKNSKFYTKHFIEGK
ncbi:MAG: LTA synthase family protein [Lachnospiraceae bacterium]|nr:LTA synthase family protein [Lachnospiraceae bacterium]